MDRVIEQKSKDIASDTPLLTLLSKFTPTDWGLDLVPDLHSIRWQCPWQDHVWHTSTGRNGESTWLKGPGFKSLQERRKNFLRQSQLPVLTLISVSVPPPCCRSSMCRDPGHSAKSTGSWLQLKTHTPPLTLRAQEQSSGAVWKSKWPSWAPRPNEPYGFCGRKATLNHAVDTVCP